MASDILGIVTEALGADVLHKISGYIGESKQETKAALRGAVPAVLAGMLEQATDGATGLTSLMGMLSSGKIDASLLTSLGSMLHGSAASDVMDTGRIVVAAALGSKASQVEHAIVEHTGVQPASAVSILGIAGAMVMAAIGKQMGGSPSVSGLTSLLASQKSAILSALPAGLGNVLGGASFRPPTAESSRGGMGRIIGFIVVAAGIFGGLFWYMSNGPADVATSAVDAPKEAPSVSALGEFAKRTLPDGVELNVPNLGIENKLLDYIDDASKKPDDATWFDFDRLLFDTGASTLQGSSQEQLRNTAEIFKAYPKVKVRIGGYTDNTGDNGANVKLSGDRANAVMAALVKLGVDASRMDAKGYGADHPVADNVTAEGRAKNRRISMRVIEK